MLGRKRPASGNKDSCSHTLRSLAPSLPAVQSPHRSWRGGTCLPSQHRGSRGRGLWISGPASTTQWDPGSDVRQREPRLNLVAVVLEIAIYPSEFQNKPHPCGYLWKEHPWLGLTLMSCVEEAASLCAVGKTQMLISSSGGSDCLVQRTHFPSLLFKPLVYRKGLCPPNLHRWCKQSIWRLWKKAKINPNDDSIVVGHGDLCLGI